MLAHVLAFPVVIRISKLTFSEEYSISGLPLRIFARDVLTLLQPRYLKLSDNGAISAVLLCKRRFLFSEEARASVRVHELDERISLPIARVGVALNYPIISRIGMVFSRVTITADFETTGNGRRMTMTVKIFLSVVVHKPNDLPTFDQRALNTSGFAVRGRDCPEAVGVVRTFHCRYRLLTTTGAPVDIMGVKVEPRPVF